MIKATVEEFIFPGDIQATAQLQRTEKLTIPGFCVRFKTERSSYRDARQPVGGCWFVDHTVVIFFFWYLNHVTAPTQPLPLFSHMHVTLLLFKRSVGWSHCANTLI